MKNSILLSLIILISTFSFGQSWSYKSSLNQFDGKYKTASIVGIGGKFPYNQPVFVINTFEKSNRINIYVTNVGFAGCDNKVALIKFDRDSFINRYTISTNSEGDTWFINEQYIADDETYTAKLLEEIKQHSKMFIRLSSDCGQGDYEFPLKGSSTAINFIAGDFLNNVEKVKTLQIQSDEIENEERKLLFKKLSSGMYFEAKINCNAPIYFGKSYTLFTDSLSKSENIVFSNYTTNNKYCILHRSSAISLSHDSIYYIKRFAIDLETIQEMPK